MKPKLLDPTVSQQIQTIQTEAVNDTPESLRQNALAGVGEGNDRVIAGDQGSFDDDLGFGNQALSQAIERKALGGYGRDMEKLESTAGYEAINRKFKKLINAGQLVAMEHAHNERARALYEAKKAARRSARGAVLGTVLGIVGTAWGGPAGGAAGYAIGKGIGER